MRRVESPGLPGTGYTETADRGPSWLRTGIRQNGDVPRILGQRAGEGDNEAMLSEVFCSDETNPFSRDCDRSSSAGFTKRGRKRNHSELEPTWLHPRNPVRLNHMAA